MRRRLIPILVLATVGVLAAGCGGSSNKNAASPATTTSTPTTTASSSSGSSSSSSTGGLSGDCKKLVDLAQKLGPAIASASSPSANLSQQVGQTAKVLKAFADSAPASVKADLETLANAFVKYAAAVKGLNLSPGKTPSPADAAKAAQAAQAFGPQVQAASQHLSQWAAKNCGGVLPTTTG